MTRKQQAKSMGAKASDSQDGDNRSTNPGSRRVNALRATAANALPALARAGRWLLFPPFPIALVITVLGIGLLAATFLTGANDINSPLAYAGYVSSFWTLVIWCARLVRANPAGGALDLARSFPVLSRIVDDGKHRLGMATAASVGIDIVYTASNAIAAVSNGSMWFTTLAAYYGVLAVMRFLLTWGILRQPSAADMRREHTLCLACGVLLVLSTPVFAGFVILALQRQSSISYSNFLIYAVALYAFYALISGIVRLVRNRRSPHPSVRAANALYLVVAAVSMLSLEVAMIDMFGEGDEWFRSTMIAGTGAAVCVLAIVTGIWMARSSARARRQTR